MKMKNENSSYEPFRVHKSISFDYNFDGCVTDLKELTAKVSGEPQKASLVCRCNYTHSHLAAASSHCGISVLLQGFINIWLERVTFKCSGQNNIK